MDKFHINRHNIRTPFLFIIKKLNVYLGRDAYSFDPINLGHLLVYIRKVLKEFELDFNKKTKKIILELSSQHNICLFGILGCCDYKNCLTCSTIKYERRDLWKDWCLYSKLVHVPSPFGQESTDPLEKIYAPLYIEDKMYVKNKNAKKRKISNKKLPKIKKQFRHWNVLQFKKFEPMVPFDQFIPEVPSISPTESPTDSRLESPKVNLMDDTTCSPGFDNNTITNQRNYYDPSKIVQLFNSYSNSYDTYYSHF